MGSYVPSPEAPHIPQLFHPQLLKIPTGIYKNLLGSICKAQPHAIASTQLTCSQALGFASDAGSLMLGQSTASPQITGRYITES